MMGPIWSGTLAMDLATTFPPDLATYWLPALRYPPAIVCVSLNHDLSLVGGCWAVG